MSVTPAKPKSQYIGRFAPSPTGPLHMGSLVAALASFLDARAHNGQWLLRVEDVDRPREVSGATDAILKSLHLHGLRWDGDIIYQSQRSQYYAAAANRLIDAGLTFWCQCSRKALAAQPVYPGSCRELKLDYSSATDHAAARSLRVRTTDHEICFNDAIQGRFCQNLATDVGDFIIQRKDHLYAYQLAVVVDDAAQNITHIVRGSDLLDSTPRQIYLQQLLGFPQADYAHIPVLINELGQKLSKQHFAPAIDDQRVTTNLTAALHYLGQPMPPDSSYNSVGKILDWATAQWDIRKIAHCVSLPSTADH